MATERGQVLPCLAVPQLDALVEAGRDEVEAVRTEGYLDDQCLVASHPSQALLLLFGLPHVHREIVRATDQDLTTSVK